MTTLRASVLLFGCGLAASGCFSTNPYLGDDEGGPSSSPHLFGPNDDQLSTPYALGTHVKIEAHLADEGWSVDSSDPSVLGCTKPARADKPITSDCVALKEGEAHVLMRDRDGRTVRDAIVQVKAADGAKLFSHGPVRLLGQDTTAVEGMQTLEAHILAGGTGVFAVAYFRGQERVFGHGIAEVPTLPGLVVENKTSSGGPSNEWIFVTPSAAGTATIPISQAGAVLASIEVTAVGEADVASIALAKEAGEKKDDDNVWVLGEGRDATGRPVLGVMSRWTLDGVAQTGTDQAMLDGDLFRFVNASGGTARTLVATHAGKTATMQVTAKRGNVFDTTYLGCTAAPGVPASGGGALAFLGIVALWLVVRATRRAGTAVVR